MKPWHEAANLQAANLKLAELIAVEFPAHELADLDFDALPVTRALDGKRIATAVFAYPRGRAERLVGCVFPPLRELVS